MKQFNIPDKLKKFCEKIVSEGGKPYLVGGSVRDYLLDMPFKDYDLEVFNIQPKHLRKICRRSGRVSLVGAAFAVLKVELEKSLTIDVSMPRKEVATGYAHKSFDVSVDPYMSLKEAANRRDLTVNAISMDPLSGEILDPYHGKRDLDRKVLRHISPKFSEDPLRVLRVIRFAAQLGFDVHSSTLELCRKLAESGALQNLPRERIEEELKRLFTAGIPGHIFTALKFAAQMDIYRVLFPELFRLQGVPQDVRYHAEGDCFIHTLLTIDRAAWVARREKLSDEDTYILCLAAMTHDLGKAETTRILDDGSIISHGHDKAGEVAAKNLLARITTQKNVIARVIALTKTHMRPLNLFSSEKVTDSAMRRLAKAIEPSTIAELACLVEADTLASIQSPDYQGKGKMHAYAKLRERAALLGVEKKPLPPLIRGRDLMRMAGNGLLPPEYRHGGEHFKKILDAVYEAQLDGKISNESEARQFVISALSPK